MDVQAKVRALYKKLLALYPRRFREQLGEFMEQTFDDLCNERKQTANGLFLFVFGIFIETGLGIVRERMVLMAPGDSMKTIISNPGTAAITSLILSLPLGLIFVAFIFEIEQLARPLTTLLTVDGNLNILGRIVVFGGLLLLPVAFVLNLQPMLKRQGPEGKRRLYAISIIVGAIILLLITFTWGGLLVEEVYCLRGIRCD